MTSYQHEDSVKANIGLWQMFKSLWPYGKGARTDFWVSIVSVILVGLSSRLMPTIIGYAIDSGIMKNDSHVVVQMAFAFFFMEILYASSSFTYSYFFQKFGNRVVFNLRERLHHHIQHLPMTFFDRTPTGRIVTRLTNDTATLGDLAADGLVNILVNCVTILSVLIALFLISPTLAFWTLLSTPIFIAISVWLTKIMRETLRESKKKFSELNAFATERINGMKTVQILGLESAVDRRFRTTSQEYRGLLMKSIRTSVLLHPTMNVYNALTIAIALAVGGRFSVESGLAVGSLVAFLMHIQDMIPMLREILDKYQQFQNSLTSAERVFHLLDEKVESNPSLLVPNTRPLDVILKNLSFRYQDHMPWVLQDLNLHIPAGTRTALIGRTGSGKSTLISLLMRFYDPPHGTVVLGGRPLEEWSRQELRRKVGLVQQDPFIFRGSLFENVSLGESSISQSTVEKALLQIGYLQLLKRTHRDLSFSVEEKGANLSAGERQLIAFARVMTFQPELLILDEATANVDSETEAILQKATEEILKGRTSIVIAHRLSTVQNSDHIYVLDQGRLAEDGSPAQLIEKKGMFFQYLEENRLKNQSTSTEDKAFTE